MKEGRQAVVSFPGRQGREPASVNAALSEHWARTSTGAERETKRVCRKRRGREMIRLSGCVYETEKVAE